MSNSRDSILEMLSPLIAEFIQKSMTARISNKETAKLRISYANSLSNLIRAYDSLLSSKELEEIQEELQEIKNAIESKS